MQRRLCIVLQVPLWIASEEKNRFLTKLFIKTLHALHDSELYNMQNNLRYAMQTYVSDRLYQWVQRDFVYLC
jgi:hypothetical protein